jgi:hypothetical protein
VPHADKFNPTDSWAHNYPQPLRLASIAARAINGHTPEPLLDQDLRDDNRELLRTLGVALDEILTLRHDRGFIGRPEMDISEHRCACYHSVTGDHWQAKGKAR